LKRIHFEAFRPLCPACRSPELETQLEIGSIQREKGADIEEGILLCPNLLCQREFPIIDGIPIIVRPIREFLNNQVLSVLGRRDLSTEIASLIGDACGPGTLFEAERQMLSSYGHNHYGDLDPAAKDAAAGSSHRLAREALGLAPPASGLRMDIGCALGRSTFSLAEDSTDPVLGIDLSFAMLRAASQVLKNGQVRYPLRRVGLVYDEKRFDFQAKNRHLIDFWACDACALPFSAGRVAYALSLNVLDCVPSPYQHLASLAQVLGAGGTALLATPYDWSVSATPVEAWIGGHSQRSPESGASEKAIRTLLENAEFGLKIIAEEASKPWAVRIHDRHSSQYQVHLLAAQQSG
jgi:SAM-dependent methyltransferase/uncharacterized protein YbaR (Trm112 family)